MAELSPETIKEFVMSAHFNLERVKELLAQYPDLLNVKQQWGENDYEDALGAASHVGNREIAEYLLEQGAPVTITTAAMLGDRDEVERILSQNPNAVFSTGAHKIPLLVHAALSGDPGLLKMLYDKGAVTGVSMAMLYAASRGYVDSLRWLLGQGADVTVQNYEGKTALELAQEQGHQDCVDVLKAHGA